MCVTPYRGGVEWNGEASWQQLLQQQWELCCKGGDYMTRGGCGWVSGLTHHGWFIQVEGKDTERTFCTSAMYPMRVGWGQGG